MPLEKVKNESSIKNYKSECKQRLAKERRNNWQQEALKEYENSEPKYVWESIDGENFAEN